MKQVHHKLTAGLEVHGYAIMFIKHFFKGRQLLSVPVCSTRLCCISKMGSIVMGKNLLIMEQLVSERPDPIKEGDKN